MFVFPTWQCFLDRHATRMHNSTAMCAIYLHTTCRCTSSLYARYKYVLLRPKYFVMHVCINNILQFQVFSQPQKLEIDFLISHIHKTVEVVSSQNCADACTHALNFSKIFRLHLQKSAYALVFAYEYFGRQNLQNLLAQWV